MSNSDVEPLTDLPLNMAGLLLAETIFYVQSKAQAKLFLASKVTAMQQEQLFNLLDSVPDSVLICS